MQKKSWKFGTREVVYAAIGAALYAVLSLATNWLQLPSAGNVSFRPAIVIPMFFGVVFGPIVGFITGFLGNIISDLIGGYVSASFESGISRLPPKAWEIYS